MRDYELRDYEFVESDRHARTIDESFCIEPPRQSRLMYNASSQFSVEALQHGNGKSCLMIGSPVFHVKVLEKMGWDVTYMDVREPPVKLNKFIQRDATDMKLCDESFDAIDSSCVLSHAGMGRYGDPLVEDGDEKMMCEMYRVLKPGCPATLMFGNVAVMPKMVVLGTCHRVYTKEEAERIALHAGFVVEKTRLWSLKHLRWVKHDRERSVDYFGKPDYLAMLVRKPT